MLPDGIPRVCLDAKDMALMKLPHNIRYAVFLEGNV